MTVDNNVSLKPQTKKELLVHIGMPKSASTYLQQEIFPQLQDEVDYFGPYNNSLVADIFYLATELWNNGSSYMKSQEFIVKFNAIVGVLENSEKKRIILSSESFCGHPSGGFGTGEHIAKLFNLMPFDIKILFVIRKQDSFFKSLYLHSVKKENILNKKQFLKLDSMDRDFKPDNYGSHPHTKFQPSDWRSMALTKYLSYYKKTVDKGDFLAVPFELFLRDKPMFIEKILEFFAIKKKVQISKDFVNRGASKAEILARRFLINPLLYSKKYSELNLFERGFVRLTLLIVRKGIDLIYFQKPNPLTQKEKVQIQSFYKESNQKFADVLHLDLKKYQYY